MIPDFLITWFLRQVEAGKSEDLEREKKSEKERGEEKEKTDEERRERKVREVKTEKDKEIERNASVAQKYRFAFDYWTTICTFSGLKNIYFRLVKRKKGNVTNIESSEIKKKS